MPLLNKEQVLLKLWQKLIPSTIAEHLCLHHHRLTWYADDRPIRVACTTDQRGRIKQNTTYHIRCSQCNLNYVLTEDDVT